MNAVLRKWDCVFSLGLAVSTPVGKKFCITLEARNNAEFYNIGTSTIYMNQSVKTTSTNLLLGISYKLWDRKSI